MEKPTTLKYSVANNITKGTFMKKITQLFILIFFSLNIYALDLKKYDGIYNTQTDLPGIITIETNGTYLNLTFGPEETWHPELRNVPIVFKCENDYTCSAPPFKAKAGKCYFLLNLLPSGKVSMTQGSGSICVGNIMFLPLTKKYPTNKWNFKQNINSEGFLSVQSSILDHTNSSRLTTSCTAPSSELYLSISIDSILWKTISLIETDSNERFFAVLEVNGNEYQLDNIHTAEKNVLRLHDPLSKYEIMDLKNGSEMTLTFQSINANNEVYTLTQLDYSLRGSSNSISKAQKNCAGNFELENSKIQLLNH